MKDGREKKMIWFTSDSHFGHENIIEYTERPFDNVTEMDEEIIRRWNEVVSEDDIVYHLGDFTLSGWDVARNYTRKLSGVIHFLSNPWHHDRRWLREADNEWMPWWTTMPPLVVLEFPEYSYGKHPLSITLCHYPLAEWDRKHYGGWHLHGHSHGKYDPNSHSNRYNSNLKEFIMDVGVDCHDFYPISLDDIAYVMGEYGWHPKWRRYE